MNTKAENTKRMWYYETRCRRCDKLNRWVLTPNGPLKGDLPEPIAKHQAYSNEFPFRIEACEHCKMETRQERVGWQGIRYAE